MNTYSLTHVPDAELIRNMDSVLARADGATAEVVAHIAEIDARKLHEAAGYESMHAYCVERFHLSEDGAYRRIQAARAARVYPRLFHELADGLLNLSSICLLAPHLSAENIDEFVEAARHRSNAAIRDWLVARMVAKPRAAIPAARQLEVRLPRPAPLRVRVAEPPSPALLEQTAVETPPDAGPIEFEMRFTMSREDHERFRYAQALLSHAVPSGDVAEIYRRAIEAVIAGCEKRKCAATRQAHGESREDEAPAPGRHVPAHVRRAVWLRDGGRCTWVAPSGHRCAERRFLEFDHIVPVARGGHSSVDNVRLRCRAHNQDAAKRVLGAKLMNERRRRAAVATTIRQALPAARGVRGVRGARGARGQGP